MYSYCTLFDSNYLTRGLAMYESLEKESDDFHLYVFAFDNNSYELLKKLKYQSMTVISLEDFEDEELLKIKPERNVVEYCWTCTPSVIKYAIEKFNLDSCTYLDADLYFFNDPAVLIEEMEDKSILITEHRYTKKYDQVETSGVYCVQFMTFKNDTFGMNALNWWRDACLEWCYSRYEDGKFGDQKYLDDWLIRFKGVHVLKNLGGGVAPWNVQQYNLEKKEFELVFYHFHGLKFISDSYVELGNYKLKKIDLEILYIPYLQHLEDISSRLITRGETFDYNGVSKVKFSWKTPIRIIRRLVSGEYNVFKKSKFSGVNNG